MIGRDAEGDEIYRVDAEEGGCDSGASWAGAPVEDRGEAREGGGVVDVVGCERMEMGKNYAVGDAERVVVDHGAQLWW